MQRLDWLSVWRLDSGRVIPTALALWRKRRKKRKPKPNGSKLRLLRGR
ncbi:hypothetical protein CHD2B1_054 [Escherichia phage vB_EcoS-CHD2B1]|nr:hypothetical protein 22664B1_019 [Escherichia phage vB_EcoS-22664B1]QZI79008.1 hypothetical protein 101114B2_018 [Escherichia phage vB_EcoS-101114B2]USL86310.1 hypothetical protein CHD2B1_054 [Escherichia phage vB_EcoS-CHD2B1]